MAEACVGRRRAWSLSGDRIFATSDGGAHWRLSYRPTGSAVPLELAFCDARHGFAVGGDGLIIATRDGGKTWQQQRLSPGGMSHGLYGIACVHVTASGTVAATRRTSGRRRLAPPRAAVPLVVERPGSAGTRRKARTRRWPPP